jgi:hypothetical protein
MKKMTNPSSFAFVFPFETRNGEECMGVREISHLVVARTSPDPPYYHQYCSLLVLGFWVLDKCY